MATHPVAPFTPVVPCFAGYPKRAPKSPPTRFVPCNRICIATDDPYSHSSRRYTSNSGGPSVFRSPSSLSFSLSLFLAPSQTVRSRPLSSHGTALPPRSLSLTPAIFRLPRGGGPSRTATARTRARPHRERRQSRAIRSCADARCKPVTRFWPASAYSQSSIQCSRNRCVIGPGHTVGYSRILLPRHLRTLGDTKSVDDITQSGHTLGSCAA